MNPSQIVEAVLFASDAPLKADEIARADEALDEDQVEEALQELTSFYVLLQLQPQTILYFRHHLR